MAIRATTDADQGKLIELLRNLLESQEQAEYDFCGEQRDWHLPRLNRAAALAVQLFPLEMVVAMGQAEDPSGRKIAR